MPSRRPVSFYGVRRFDSPAVATDMEIRARGQGILRIPSLRFRFVADGTAASRTIILLADDGTSEFFRATFDVAVAAGGDVLLSAYTGAIRQPLSAGVVTVPLPTDGITLWPGWRLRTETAAMQAGDQYSGIAALVQEFPVGPLEEWTPGVSTLIDTLE